MNYSSPGNVWAIIEGMQASEHCNTILQLGMILVEDPPLCHFPHSVLWWWWWWFYFISLRLLITWSHYGTFEAGVCTCTNICIYKLQLPVFRFGILLSHPPHPCLQKATRSSWVLCPTTLDLRAVNKFQFSRNHSWVPEKAEKQKQNTWMGFLFTSVAVGHPLSKPEFDSSEYL